MLPPDDSRPNFRKLVSLAITTAAIGGPAVFAVGYIAGRAQQHAMAPDRLDVKLSPTAAHSYYDPTAVHGSGSPEIDFRGPTTDMRDGLHDDGSRSLQPSHDRD